MYTLLGNPEIKLQEALEKWFVVSMKYLKILMGKQNLEQIMQVKYTM